MKQIKRWLGIVLSIMIAAGALQVPVYAAETGEDAIKAESTLDTSDVVAVAVQQEDAEPTQSDETQAQQENGIPTSPQEAEFVQQGEETEKSTAPTEETSEDGLYSEESPEQDNGPEDGANATADQPGGILEENGANGEENEIAIEASVTENPSVTELVAESELAGGEKTELTGVELNHSKLRVPLGGTAKLVASAVPENAVNEKFIWEIADEDIATVDQSGNITTVSRGTTTVYVYSDGYQYYDSCELEVTRINLSSASVLRISGSRPYTGSKIEPVPTVKLDGVTLQAGTDYKVNYSRNTNVGTATVIITGLNDYSGKITRTFEIVKAANTITKISPSTITLPQSIINAGSYSMSFVTQDKFSAKITYEQLSVTSAAPKYITLSSGGKLTFKKGIPVGTYKIKIRVNAAEAKNYKKASATKTITVVIRKNMRQYSTLEALGVKGYSQAVDRKVNTSFDKMIVDLNGAGFKYASLSDYEKAYLITLYIGSTYYYKDGSYNAESMIDKGYGTCFAYSDLTYLMAKKAGLANTWLTVPGRNVNHNGMYYGSQHRSVVTKIGANYYELDSNRIYNEVQLMSYGYPVDFTPEKISESYAKYLIGQAKTYKTIY